ncbi:unnamed protein product [Amoebophrya sp. A120]|nr:unnamed protein product [Amoebophrya sp. A120]|eukprot:GSA120T00007139001.1
MTSKRAATSGRPRPACETAPKNVQAYTSTGAAEGGAREARPALPLVCSVVLWPAHRFEWAAPSCLFPAHRKEGGRQASAVCSDPPRARPPKCPGRAALWRARLPGPRGLAGRGRGHSFGRAFAWQTPGPRHTLTEPTPRAQPLRACLAARPAPRPLVGRRGGRACGCVCARHCFDRSVARAPRAFKFFHAAPLRVGAYLPCLAPSDTV